MTSSQELSQANLPADLSVWLQTATDRLASDLHLVPGYVPMARCAGVLAPIGESVLTESAIAQALNPFLGEDVISMVERHKNLDFAATVALSDSKFRLRFNLFRNAGMTGACIRIIPAEIPTFSWASFPEDLADKLLGFPNGLILFTGVTGAGKSTSLAMIIQRLNKRGGKRILTIENPIEYRFPQCNTSIITQRELGDDVESFEDGLKFGLRQDPDVILVGEIRDRETAAMTLSSTETGHLVFSTIHTRDAKGAISRYADFFPQSSQNEIRSQLASLLRSVVCQRLVANATPGEKQELALEVLHNNAPISAAIRSGKLESIDNYILTGRSEGMITMNESIKRLLLAGRIRQDSSDALSVY